MTVSPAKMGGLHSDVDEDLGVGFSDVVFLAFVGDWDGHGEDG